MFWNSVFVVFLLLVSGYLAFGFLVFCLSVVFCFMLFVLVLQFASLNCVCWTSYNYVCLAYGIRCSCVVYDDKGFTN